MDTLEQVQFLIDSCPQMKYLQLGLINSIDIKANIQCILTKIMTVASVHYVLFFQLLTIRFSHYI
jgi:hypothetical protein